MENCIFCKIVKKELPSQTVYEDNEILAFKDINPVAPVHVLVIPKKHLNSLNDLTPEDGTVVGNILLVIKKLAAELGVADSGYRVVVNVGADGGQQVGHLHFHLIGGKALGTK
ncbi:MAG: histidine triad nucleotide-binding protein, partial [Peptococcaceae bacterium]|nr:histidine triad nucleotide-binding protein [Peptococcaceae bacterium]